jgi:hypothetical protein
MTLNELIERYINKHYFITTSDNKIVVGSFYDDSVRESYKVVNEVSTIFGLNHTETHMLFQEWFTQQKKLLTGKVIEHLNKFRVEMTMIDWVVIDEKGESITFDKMINMLRKHYEVDAIVRLVCEDWFSEKQLEYNKRNFDFY